MSCEHCEEGDGTCIFPYKGTAPHMLNETQWPENFKPELNPDGFSSGIGVYEYCMYCKSRNT